MELYCLMEHPIQFILIDLEIIGILLNYNNFLLYSNKIYLIHFCSPLINPTISPAVLMPIAFVVPPTK